MKNIDGLYFPDIDVSTPQMIEKSKRVARHGFQLDNLREALQFVNSWDTAIDGGANIGTWTCVLAKKFKNVYSFELAPDTFECLQKNIDVWDIRSNVHPMNQALSNNHRLVGVVDGKAKRSRSGGRHIGGHGDIKTTTIDSLNLSSLDFLKLDVEGHESQALEGAQETLKRFHPVVLIENKFEFDSRRSGKSAVDILRNLGASVVHKAGKNQIDWIFVW